MRTQEEIYNELAKAGYETMFEERWDDLHPRSIERAMWVNIAQATLKRLRELYTEGEEVSTS